MSTWKPLACLRGAFVLLLLAGVAVAFVAAPAAAGGLDRIKKNGKVVIGTEAALPPFEFVKDGKIVGYGKDILDYVVKDLGVEVEQLDLPWQGILPGLSAKKFDFVATSVTLFPARAKKYAFTMPIAEATHFAIKRKGVEDIKAVDDLIGKRLGVQLGAAGEKSAKWLVKKWKEEGKGGFKELKLYMTNPEAYLALANGDVDGVIHSLPTLAYLMKNRPDTYEFVGPVREQSWYAWVTHPDDTDLRDYISSKIKELRDSGKLYELQEKWFGFRMKVPDSGYLPEGAL